jgi:hypothetical protein
MRPRMIDAWSGVRFGGPGPRLLAHAEPLRSTSGLSGGPERLVARTRDAGRRRVPIQLAVEEFDSGKKVC